MNKVIGIVLDHGNDEWSVWITDFMSARDQATIREILEKYRHDGCSVKGQDVRKDIEKMMEG